MITSIILNQDPFDGFDIEIFNFKALKQAKKNSKSKSDLEHVTPFMLRSKKK